MSVLMEASVSTSDFLFQNVLTNYPSCTIQLEPSISIDAEMVPYVWTADVPSDRLEGLLSSEPHVRDAEIVDTTNGGFLVRLAWDDDENVNPLLATLRGLPVAVSEAVGTGGGWNLTLRFQTADAVSRFYRGYRSANISVNPLRIQQNAPWMNERRHRYGLTATQRKTLVEAYESGYFEVPRKTSLVELADRHGVSSNAVSERLRRGIDTLLGNALVEPKQLVRPEEKPDPRLEND
ncbi:helix-turn-helix domain-containing protein [Halogeometricum luteum]|uniref:Helix-turn-helix domain-containing protein n=1 Tax=Halogeometricum luteum TaxID=2950537 RepID=A0ABU2G4S1_9EURY|nr:helix-turn-helix domain-containing protein [Halogeometricum sp. S3BR5-2]MDS0295294.1 helix-turn-helix domain-containing protein [Halogeometricum sp. S3BR5-2]